MYISIKCHLLPHNLSIRSSSLGGGRMSMKLLKGQERRSCESLNIELRYGESEYVFWICP